MRHCKYDAESFRHSSESARMLFSLRHAMYDSFASEHSRKWSSGNEPLSGGLGGNPRDGMEALDAIVERSRDEHHATPLCCGLWVH